MALYEFDCKGYGQLEPSQVSWNRDGRVEAQCELDPVKFASHFPVLPSEAAQNKIVAEVGAFLVCDKVKKIATLPTKALSDAGWVAGINYSTEKIYNQFTPGRRNVCMVAGEYLPRIGFPEAGERICTNSVVIRLCIWECSTVRFRCVLLRRISRTCSHRDHFGIRSDLLHSSELPWSRLRYSTRWS